MYGLGSRGLGFKMAFEASGFRVYLGDPKPTVSGIKPDVLKGS